MVQIDNLVRPRVKQILLSGLASLAWFHCRPLKFDCSRVRITVRARRNSSDPICKKLPLKPQKRQNPILRKLDHSTQPQAREFFTDDDL